MRSLGTSADILVVEDEPTMRRLLRRELADLGYGVTDVGDVDGARRELDARSFDLVLTDLALGPARMEGLDVLVRAREAQPGVPVVILTAHGSVDVAVDAIKRGAFDFLEKPLGMARLAVTLAKGVHAGRQERELALMRRERGRLVAAEMVGQSAEMESLKSMIKQVAATDATVLIQGESGAGKELVARALHEGSRRRERPFVAVDCGALEGNLLASEMFGHVKGAFTGAETSRQGLFQAAHHGTLFLDEIGNLPLDLQARLLRVLQERRVRPIGGNTERELDVRVVAATNRDLVQSTVAGTFRQDLYYRLAVVTLKVPPLRDRPGDVRRLAEHLVQFVAQRLGRGPITFSPEVLDGLEAYPWPGNVRELSNVVERAVVMSTGGTIRTVDLPALPRQGSLPGAEVMGSSVEPLRDTVRRAEREAIVRALEQAGGSRVEAARSLGISRRALYDKLEKLRIAAS